MKAEELIEKLKEHPSAVINLDVREDENTIDCVDYCAECNTFTIIGAM